jgi:ribosomal protein S18 acetylase RimI-like enzyme
MFGKIMNQPSINYKLRPIALSQVHELSELAKTAYCETFGHLYPPDDLSYFLSTTYKPDILSAELTEQNAYWQGLFIENEMIGYLQCGPVSLPHPDANLAKDGELKRIYLLKSYQGCGLGRLLMDNAMTYLKSAYKDQPLWLGVFSENPRAQALYQKEGFEKVGDYEFIVGKTRDAEWIMRRLP